MKSGEVPVYAEFYEDRNVVRGNVVELAERPAGGWVS